jgi:hypothetical protein
MALKGRLQRIKIEGQILFLREAERIKIVAIVLERERMMVY